MEKIDDGGAAFPTANYDKPGEYFGSSIMTIRGGMSLRDWFAGQALVGVVTYREDVEPLSLKGSLSKTHAEIIAENVYFMADAMIKERNNNARD